MIVLGNFLIAAAQILGIIFSILYWLILIRALISWVNPDPYNPIVQFLNRATEPILTPIRRRMPNMTVDFSPIIAFLIIIFLKAFLVGSLYDMGVQLKYKNQRQYSAPDLRLRRQAPVQDSVSSDELFN